MPETKNPEDETAEEGGPKGLSSAGWTSLSRVLEGIPRPERRMKTVSVTSEDISGMSMSELRRHAQVLGLRETEKLLRPELSTKIMEALGSPLPRATCPMCLREGPVPDLFGFRITKTETKTKGVVVKRIRQSWCRFCRSKHAKHRKPVPASTTDAVTPPEEEQCEPML